VSKAFSLGGLSVFTGLLGERRRDYTDGHIMIVFDTGLQHRSELQPRTALVLLCLAVLWLAGPSRAQQASPPDTPAAGPVFHLVLDSPIHPVAVEIVEDALADADAAGAQALVLELSTPGGLETSMRKIFTAMLGAATPVVVYVSPGGARAASAGFFILVASDVAAMAPGTNAGAAAVVAGGGQDIEGTLGKKVQQDAAATIRSLAAQKGRDPEAAESAVLEARSFSAGEALEAGLIDLIAPTLQGLLEQLDGRVVEKGGRSVTLATAGVTPRPVEISRAQRILAFLADPNIAYMLLTLGGLAIYLEVMNPGTILPGVLGVLSLSLAFFGLAVLPVNVAGVVLILLALGMFVAEVKVQSLGLLTLGGVASLVVGSLMLFKDVAPQPVFEVSRGLIAAIAVVALLVVGAVVVLWRRASRTKVRTGAEGMLHERGVARSAFGPGGPAGKVFVHGEIGHAVAGEPVAAGEPVEVTAIAGLKIRVRPVREPAPLNNPVVVRESS
jgi:membrane-bound serine protease (ClpP class)